MHVYIILSNITIYSYLNYIAYDLHMHLELQKNNTEYFFILFLQTALRKLLDTGANLATELSPTRFRQVSGRRSCEKTHGFPRKMMCKWCVCVFSISMLVYRTACLSFRNFLQNYR